MARWYVRLRLYLGVAGVLIVIGGIVVATLGALHVMPWRQLFAIGTAVVTALAAIGVTLNISEATGDRAAVEASRARVRAAEGWLASALSGSQPQRGYEDFFIRTLLDEQSKGWGSQHYADYLLHALLDEPSPAERPTGGAPSGQGEKRKDSSTVSEPPSPTTAAWEPPDDRLALAALWTVTHERLDLYHRIATGQARRSFLTAQLAMTAGFILLIVSAVFAVQAHTPAAAITSGGLGAVAAAFAAYIGRTFVRSQESAASHLRAYFDQPLEFSRFLAAERLLSAAAGGLDGKQHSEILALVVQSIVGSSGTGTPGRTKRTRTSRSRESD